MNVTKLALITIGALLLLGLSVFAAYRYSQTKKADIVLPAGNTYLGATPTVPLGPSATAVPTKPIIRFKAESSVKYKKFIGTLNPYEFSYPETLTLVIFPTNPPTDSVAIVWNDIPPQQNILLNIEVIKDRNPDMVGKPKSDFVQNWWRHFSGLKGVASMTTFTNSNNLKGYKAQYINSLGQYPNVDVFLEVPGRDDIMVHLANGILDWAIFDAIVDSVSWNSPSPTK